MPTLKRNKKGGEGTLNSHIENYIKAEKDDDQNAMDEHKTLYMNAYAEHMGVPKMIQKKLAFGLIPGGEVINPRIQASFDKRLQDEKDAQKDAYKLEQKRQEEIIKRNLRKDKIKQMNRKNMERSGAFKENIKAREIQTASKNYLDMLQKMKKRGSSTLRIQQQTAGKRKTRKNKKKKKKTRKNKKKHKKKSRKHKKRNKRGGMQRMERVGNSSLKKIKQDGNFYVIKIDPSGKPLRDTNGNVKLYDYKNAINNQLLQKKGIMKESNPQEGSGKNKKRKH